LDHIFFSYHLFIRTTQNLKRAFGNLSASAISFVLRPFLAKTISSQRISWLFFKKLFDREKDKITAGRAVCINSENLNEYLDNTLAFAQLVIAGGSDHDVTEIELKKMVNKPSVTFFVQNLQFEETVNVKLLPIGVQDLKWASSGLPWNFSKALAKEKRQRILVGPFSPTHPERNDCIKYGRVALNCDLLEKKISTYAYAKISASYSFVACPRGNGLDTHRIWETLYRGSFPVMVKSSFSKVLISYGLPILEIDSWSLLSEIPLSDVQLAFFEKQQKGLEYISQAWWQKRLLSYL